MFTKPPLFIFLDSFVIILYVHLGIGFMLHCLSHNMVRSLGFFILL